MRKSIEQLNIEKIVYAGIIENYCNGESLLMLSKKLKIPYPTIYKNLKEKYNLKELQQKHNLKLFEDRVTELNERGIFIKLNPNSEEQLTYSQWKGVKDKYYFSCTNCKIEYKYVTYDQINESKLCLCKNCSMTNMHKQQILDYSYILEEVKSVDSEMRIIADAEMLESEWSRVVDKYWFKCNTCGEWVYKEYRQFVREDGGKCTDCKGCVINWDIHKVKKYCESVSSKFISDEWNLTDDKYNFKCTSCDVTITKSFTKFYSGQTRCESCLSKSSSDRQMKTHEDYLKELKYKNINISPVENYKGNNTPIYHKCPKCLRYDWSVTPSNLLSLKANACMACRTSLGEEAISIFLSDNNIDYLREYKFDNLRSVKNYPLRFDFAVFKNSELYCIIEYDGEHHYKPVVYNSKVERAEINFQNLKNNDEIKNKYCVVNKINLIRVPYWDRQNINTILLNNSDISNLIERECIHS